ncbi:ABC transporter substrate-binding protein [Nonomuraea sp. NEAU-A123]|uniref:ABC transporter substrate-binding protein n=1 Tax=Nonomuraea sp. NEAU-A123 TaxID=2839649 RepID=UPI001BE3F562|nr:ABC transporter substrate-binding protein [Nonomuraea sp. NEAU-A123]MBT2225267.1 ABC transporter substrate-binding protein [Nonomuraea sp. NEAU-A123]
MKHRNSLTLATALALSSALLTACGGSSSAGSDGTTTVTVGVGGNIFDTPLKVADANGYFSKRGIKLNYVTLTSATGISTLQSGSVQFLTTSPNDLLSAIAKKLPMSAISAVGFGQPLGLVVSTKFAQAHGLTSTTPVAQVAKALASSTPGYSSPNTKAEAGIFLKAYGVDPEKLKWVSLPSPVADQAALKNNQIDWFITSEPLPLQIQHSGDGVVVADPLTVPQWNAKASGYSLFVVAKTSYAAQHSDVAKKFVAAIQDATNYMATHPGDATVLGVVQKTLPNVPADVLKNSLELVDWAQSGKMSDADWSTTIAFLNSLGTIKDGAKITSSNWTNEYLP